MEQCKHVHKMAITADGKLLNPSSWNCDSCGTTESVWACLTCGHVACGRFIQQHSAKHFQSSQHPIALEINEGYAYCYECDDYILNDNKSGDIRLLRDVLSVIKQQSFATRGSAASGTPSRSLRQRTPDEPTHAGLTPFEMQSVVLKFRRYGVRIRLPHAIVMTFLWGKGSLSQKLFKIFNLTKIHSSNLAKMAFTYKLQVNTAAKLQGSPPKQWQTLLAAGIAGYFVFGDYNGVNMQVNLYILSRVLLGLYRLGVSKGHLPRPNARVFPLFAATIWALVLWLFEYHQPVLQPSLQHSMTYIYHDSDVWTSLTDWLIWNRL